MTARNALLRAYSVLSTRFPVVGVSKGEKSEESGESGEWRVERGERERREEKEGLPSARGRVLRPYSVVVLRTRSRSRIVDARGEDSAKASSTAADP